MNRAVFLFLLTLFFVSSCSDKPINKDLGDFSGAEAQVQVATGTSTVPVSLDTNFTNTQSNFDELYAADIVLAIKDSDQDALISANTDKVTNTDTQDLSQSGNTVSLVDGGSVDISITTAVVNNTDKVTDTPNETMDQAPISGAINHTLSSGGAYIVIADLKVRLDALEGVTPPTTVVADYYVKTGGDDALAGTSDATAWETIAKVNSATFADGDIVAFNKGDVFDDAIIGTPGVDNFTFTSYGIGDNPIIDGDVIQPFNIDDSTISNLTISNIDISGQDWQSSKANNMYIQNVDGVTLDGITGNGYRNFGGVSTGKNAIQLEDVTGNIVVKNCNLYQYGNDPFDNTGDYIALVIMGARDLTGIVSVHGNVIHDIQADGIQIYKSNTPANVYDNEIYNCGENSIDNKGSSNINYYENNMYRESGFTGMYGTPVSSTHWPLLAVQTVQGWPAQYITVHDNEFGGNDNYAIQMSGSMLVGDPLDTGTNGGLNNENEIYSNTFTGNKYVLTVLYHVNNLDFHDNTTVSMMGGGYFINDENNGAGVTVTDNSFTSVVDDEYGVRAQVSYATYLRNNFYVDDDDTPVIYRQWATSTWTDNYIYNSGANSSWVNDRGTDYGSSDAATWNSSDGKISGNSFSVE